MPGDSTLVDALGKCTDPDLTVPADGDGTVTVGHLVCSRRRPS